jgi:hypothetical protein
MQLSNKHLQHLLALVFVQDKDHDELLLELLDILVAQPVAVEELYIPEVVVVEEHILDTFFLFNLFLLI